MRKAEKRQNSRFEGGDRRAEMKHHAGVVLLRVKHLFVISLAEQRKHRSVKAVGGFDNVGDELFVCVGVKVFQLLAAVFLMAREVKIGSVVRFIYDRLLFFCASDQDFYF